MDTDSSLKLTHFLGFPLKYDIYEYVYKCGVQNITYRSYFSPPIVWVLRIEVTELDLLVGAESSC